VDDNFLEWLVGGIVGRQNVAHGARCEVRGAGCVGGLLHTILRCFNFLIFHT